METSATTKKMEAWSTKLWILLFGILIALMPQQAVCDSKEDVAYNRLLSLLTSKKYNKLTRPFFMGEPATIEIMLYVGSLRTVSEETMAFQLELYFREYWKDPRLAMKTPKNRNVTKMPLHESLAELLWIPDTFLPNAIRSVNPGYTSATHRKLLRLSSDGHLLLSRRVSVTAECPMDLTMYPFDRQGCFAIDGHPIEDLVYKWRKANPVQLNDNLELPQFTIVDVKTYARNVSLLTGVYSRLECCFFFERSAGFYFVQLFVPTTAVVFTSWLFLWVEESSSFSDMISVIVAITFLYYSYNSTMFKVSYIKAVDLYLTMCFVFVFFSLVKMAVLKFRKQRFEETVASMTKETDIDESEITKNHAVGAQLPRDEEDSLAAYVPVPPPPPPPRRQSKRASRVIDYRSFEPKSQSYREWRVYAKFMKVMRTLMIAFPLAFVAFCVCYFFTYHWLAERQLHPNCQF